MKITEQLHALGIGLHDAEVYRISIDYPLRKVEIELEIWIHDEELHPSNCDMYRRAVLTFGEMEYCAIEPPQADYPYDSGKPLEIDGGDWADLPGEPRPQPRSGDASRFRIYVQEWNSSITLVAAFVELTWLGPPHDGPRPEGAAG